MIAVVAAIMILQMMPLYKAYADSIGSSPGSIPLGGNTNITLTVDIERSVTYVAVYDPTGTLVTNSIIDTSIPLPTIPAGGSYTWRLNEDLGVYPNMVGDWLVVIDTEPGTTWLIDFGVSVFVVPESMLGAIGVVGATLGAYIAYNRIKR